MTNMYKWIMQQFGSGTPEHEVTASIVENVAQVNVTIEQPQTPMTVIFPPETKIFIDGSPRTLGDDEVIFARDVYSFGVGMTTGTTMNGEHFKALNDPQEILPLKMADTE
ncbi:MAG: hypothetical protein Q8L37_03575 [Candidatus Gottesmanbacteria bacterium]|nr:hypothetical protein [Candidatus Gottesmanbacteria bacterium]